MAHPKGGSNPFEAKHSFAQAYGHVGQDGFTFDSTTYERITARQSVARDGFTPIIVFVGERNTPGRACVACWGFRVDCNGSRIGHCAEGLDRILP